MKYSKEDNEYRNDWLTFYPKWSNVALSLDLVEYDGDRPQLHFCLGWGNFFIKLPFKLKYNDHFEAPTYGVYYHERAIWIQHGIDKVTAFHLPHDWDWVRTSKLLKSGEWIHERRGDIKRIGGDWKARHAQQESVEPLLWRETYDYTYRLKSGAIQNIKATVTVEEREWRWRWLRWLKRPSRISKTIAVKFSEEVGEERGSWKGGTVGCGYSMLKDESPEECLRRMEKERRFER
ncbi:MAG TPA: hypothetical protein VGD05_06215 [Pyrinomonadaceae bacterium]|jgi:hypothetical protein